MRTHTYFETHLCCGSGDGARQCNINGLYRD